MDIFDQPISTLREARRGQDVLPPFNRMVRAVNRATQAGARPPQQVIETVTPGAGTASIIRKFVFDRIVSDVDDDGDLLKFHFSVMQCFAVDSTSRRALVGPPAVLIALPPHIQRETWFKKNIAGFWYTDEDFPGDPFKRLSVATPGSESEMQVVTPPYVDRSDDLFSPSFYHGDIIKAVSIKTGITIKGIDVVWEDTNDQGRAWVKRTP